MRPPLHGRVKTPLGLGSIRNVVFAPARVPVAYIVHLDGGGEDVDRNWRAFKVDDLEEVTP